MKKLIFLMAIVAIFNCAFVSCSSVKIVQVEYEMVNMSFTTKHGEWDYHTMSNMIDYYYFSKTKTVDIEVVATIEMKEPFHHCTISMRLGDIVNHHNVTLASGGIGNKKEHKDLYDPGIYTISFECENVCFYYIDFSTGLIKIPIERDAIGIDVNIFVERLE